MYMDVKIKLNGKLIIDSVDQDMVLLDFCRKHNCFSVKRGCESGWKACAVMQHADRQGRRQSRGYP